MRNLIHFRILIIIFVKTLSLVIVFQNQREKQTF